MMEGMDGTQPPFARATIRRGEVTLNRWTPGLLRCGPASQILARLPRGVVLADLIGYREQGDLIAVFVPGGSGNEEARRALCDWASATGWERLWLPGEVVELGDLPSRAGRATTRCPNCRMTWHENQHDFWLRAREIGFFPSSCVACGASMPEWKGEHVADDEEAPDGTMSLPLDGRDG